MSYTTLYLVPKKGSLIDFEEYKNSHGGAPFIWSALYDKYLKDPNIKYDSWLSDKEGKLSKLVKSERLNKHEKICLASTFDKVMVKK